MSATENRRVQMTKQLLKEALLEMLQDKNINKISIRELCGNANINRSTFYQHYGSQYELLTEMENDFLDVISMELKNRTNETNNLEPVLSYINDHAALCKILISNNADEDFKERLLGLPVIVDSFNAEISNTKLAESVYVHKFIFYGGYNIVVHWLNSGCKETPRQMADILTSIVYDVIK